MPTGMSVGGASKLRRRLQASRNRSGAVVVAATKEVIALLEEKAKEILDAEVYGKSSGDDPDPADPSDSDALYNQFVQKLVEASGTKAVGELLNTSDHAIFIEDGTDEEGTGQHFVPVGGKGFLAWMGGDGNYIYSKKGHYVSGIKPIHFMSRALAENHDEVVAIYAKHLKGILGQ